jgi:hypothetical protein
MMWSDVAEEMASSVAARVSKQHSGVVLFRLVIDDGRFSSELAQWSVDAQTPALAQATTKQRVHMALSGRYGKFRGTIQVLANGKPFLSKWVNVDG